MSNETNQTVIEIFEGQIMSLLRVDGIKMGNKSLQKEIFDNNVESLKSSGIDSPDSQEFLDSYFFARQNLLEKGFIELGRGKGGSVGKVVSQESEINNEVTNEVTTRELDLYEPFLSGLKKGWIQNNYSANYTVEIFGTQGRKETGGKWSRPDLVVISHNKYMYQQEKPIRVLSFEVKKSIEELSNITSIYEALSHTYWTHESILAVFGEVEEFLNSEVVDSKRIKNECKRHGVGLMFFADPKDDSTFNMVLEPVNQNPSLDEVNNFIHRLSAETKEKVLDFLR